MERDTVLFGCSARLGFCRWIHTGRLSRGPTLVSLEDFWQGFKQCFRESLEGFPLGAAQGIEELRRTPRGCFLGVGHSWKAFWVFLGFLSRARIQSFNFFQEGEQPQIIICFLVAAAAQQQHSRREAILVILRVFLHLPCASQGAICLITSCTHFIAQYNKMAWHFSLHFLCICLYFRFTLLYAVPLLFYHFWVIISFAYIWLEFLLGFEEYSGLGILHIVNIGQSSRSSLQNKQI